MDQSRREFVRIASLAMLGACAGCASNGGIAGDTDAGDTDAAQDTGGGIDTDVGDTDSGPPAPEGWTALSLANNPKLQAAGGYVYVRLGVGKLIVARVDDTPAFIALSAVCTHSGCPVTYRTAEADLFCSCHRSVFTQDGAVTSGPAKRDLAQYEVEWDATNDRVLVHAV